MKISERIAKLIDLKSIVTLIMSVALVALLFSHIEPAKEILSLYCTSYGAVITYFFTRKDKDSIANDIKNDGEDKTK